jgi:LPXTG-motif cell wall-anchored protein
MPYTNCKALNLDFPYGVAQGHPAYKSGLDRDHDHVACEQPGGKPAQAPTPTKATTHSTGTAVQAGAGNAQLPKTGPGEVTAIGTLVMVFGVVAVMAFRRRKIRFSA